MASGVYEAFISVARLHWLSAVLQLGGWESKQGITAVVFDDYVL